MHRGVERRHAQPTFVRFCGYAITAVGFLPSVCCGIRSLVRFARPQLQFAVEAPHFTSTRCSDGDKVRMSGLYIFSTSCTHRAPPLPP